MPAPKLSFRFPRRGRPESPRLWHLPEKMKFRQRPGSGMYWNEGISSFQAAQGQQPLFGLFLVLQGFGMFRVDLQRLVPLLDGALIVL